MFNRENNHPDLLCNLASKKQVALLLLLLPFVSGCSIQTLGSFTFDTVFLFIQIVGIPFIIYVLIRIITVQMASRFMRIRSAEVTGEALHEDPAVIIPAGNLSFEEHREKENLPLNNEAANHFIRAVTTGNKGWQLFKKSLLVFMCGAIAVLFIVRYFYGVWPFRETIFLFLLTGIMHFSLYMRYSSLRRLPASSTCTSYILIMLLFFWVMHNYFVFYAVLLLVTLVFVLRGYIRNRPNDTVNRQLLILRIFGADSHTAFLFREVSRTWRFLGSIVTIADPAYLRYQYSISSRENRRRFFILFIVYFLVLAIIISVFKEELVDKDSLPTGIILIWKQMSPLSVMFVAGLIIMACSLVFVLPAVIIIIYHRFIYSMVKLQRAVQKITGSKRSISGTFKNTTLFCVDNTWKKAVQQMMPVSKAVLMDLRGFSKQNRGCEYELGLLIDNYEVNKIVLLADEGPNLELIKDILKERWQQIKASSPNANLQEPVIKIYFPGIEDRSDILRIVALLSKGLVKKEEQVTDASTTPVPDAFSLQQKKIKLPGSVLIKGNSVQIKGRPGINTEAASGAGRFEKTDLALAKPSVGKWFIPAFLLLLGGHAVYKMYPIFRTYVMYNNVKKVTALPGRQYSNDTTGKPNITVTVGTQNNGTISIWTISIAGSKLNGAYKYSDVELKLVTTEGKGLVVIYKSWDNETGLITHGNKPGDCSRISFTCNYETDTGHVTGLKGKMKLHFIASQDKFTGNGVGDLLKQTGLVEIEWHDSTIVRRLWLQRSSSAPEEVHIIYGSYCDDYEIRLFNKNGEIKDLKEERRNMNPRNYSNSNREGPFRFAAFTNAWIEIIPQKKIRTEEEWPFETKRSR